MNGGAPHFRASEGEFEVDYRSYSGAILLGEGDWLFRTSWSTAGNGSIHTYQEGGSKVAVARGASRLEDVSADVFKSADFTSRSRHPQEGEVVLWSNSAGYAAAAEIRRVRVSKESEARTVLDARYRILTDKSCDFRDVSDVENVALNGAVERALQAFDDVSSLTNDEREVGIGHNQPPEAQWLVKADYEAVAAQLRESLQNRPDNERLAALKVATTEAAARIAAAVAYRAQLMREGFYQQLGAAGALALCLSVWLILAGRLQDVGTAAAALGEALFGWKP